MEARIAELEERIVQLENKGTSTEAPKKPPKKPRKPNAYNEFVKEHLEKLKTTRPDLKTHQERFKECATLWKAREQSA